jgi:peptidoglycan/xylan/chitin deacetylase (PgdA/CDA1 family)
MVFAEQVSPSSLRFRIPVEPRGFPAPYDERVVEAVVSPAVGRGTGRVSIIRSWTKRALQTVGWYHRRLRSRTFPGPLVLCYHAILPDDADRSLIPFEPLHVSASRFEQHCRAIRESCDPIDLSEFLNGADRARPVLVTFDDGHRNLLTEAAPILAKYEIPAMLFACTGPMQTGEAMWCDRAAQAFGESEVERLKGIPDDGRRAVCAKTPAYPFSHEHCRFLSIPELRQLASTTGWSIGGHTHNHPILGRCSNDVQAHEINENFRLLEEVVGSPPIAFAYPNGRPGLDYDDCTMSLLRERGIRAAFTTQTGFTVAGTPPLEVPRMMMSDGVTGAELLHRMAVSWLR